MRVIRWKNAVTGVESLNITATGIYFPVGKTDSSFIARYSMVSAGQTASVERVSSPNGSRVGSPAINVSGTTEVVVNERRGLSTGIIVTAISGTLISVLDDNTPITNFPDAGLGRFPAKEDADAYVYGSTVPQGIPATINGVQYSYGGGGVGWRENPLAVDGWDEWALVGDSITAAGSGWNGGTNLEENGGRYNPNLSVPSIAGMLSGGRLNISRNFGFGGRAVEYVLSQMSMITGGRWKNYIVQIGTNNLSSESPNFDFSSASNAYAALIDGILSTAPRYLIGLAIPSKTTLRPQKWNYICRNICASRGVDFIDPWLTTNDQATGLLSALNTAGDGVHPTVAGKALYAAPTLLVQMQKYLGQYPARIPCDTTSAPYDPTTTLVQNGYFTRAWVSGIPSQYAVTGSFDTIVVSDAVQPSIFTGKVLRVAAANLNASASLYTNNIVVTSGIEYEFSLWIDLNLSKNLFYKMRIDYHNAANTVIASHLVHRWDVQSQLQQDSTNVSGVYRGRMMPPSGATYCKMHWVFETSVGDYATIQPVDFSLAAIEVHVVD